MDDVGPINKNINGDKYISEYRNMWRDILLGPMEDLQNSVAEHLVLWYFLKFGTSVEFATYSM